jgi:hypothetical protein
MRRRSTDEQQSDEAEAEREFANVQNFVKDTLICRTSKTEAH